MIPNPFQILLKVSSSRLVVQNLKKNLCQDLTEADQREKDPVPAGKWGNVVMVKTVPPDRSPLWAEVWEEEWAEVSVKLLAELPNEEQEGVLEEAREETPGRIRCPGIFQ